MRIRERVLHPTRCEKPSNCATIVQPRCDRHESLEVSKATVPCLRTHEGAAAAPVGLRSSLPTESHSRAKRKRNEFMITETELRLIAGAAIMGLNRSPNAG